MRKGVIFIVLLISVFVIGCAKSDIGMQPDNGMQTTPLEEQSDYVGEQTTVIHKDFRAIMKADWKELEVPPSTLVYLPPGTAEDDVNAEYISIVSTPLGESQWTLDSLLEQGIENSKKVMPDFELTDELTDGIASIQPAKRIIFTGTQDGIMRNNVQVFGMKNNVLYGLTYSCPIESCNYYPIFNVLVESFEPVAAK